MMASICFVAHTAFGELSGGRGGSFGGIQRQQSLMARWLAARGYRVSMITWDEGQPDGLTIDGVRAIRLCRSDAGWLGLRFFYPRWTSLLRALRRADADLYYHNSAEYVTGQVALWCRATRRRFVYSVASDPACEADLAILPTRRERLLYRYGLRTADQVITQTRHQQDLLCSNFCVESLVIPMPCPDPAVGEPIPRRTTPAGSSRVLWVGRIAEMKRPEMLLSIAEALPGLVFDLAGGPDVDTPYSRAILERALALPNVIVHGRVEREQLHRLYQSASILCCTSSYEGFPNTFLEAWSHGLPVVSTVDPDDLIKARALGAAAPDLPGLLAALQRILAAPDEWGDLSASCRRYYLAHHTPDSAMAQFDSVFRHLLPAARQATPVAPSKRPV
jgi:glycosyltransferase involved in cell wall biosynthesis